MLSELGALRSEAYFHGVLPAREARRLLQREGEFALVFADSADPRNVAFTLQLLGPKSAHLQLKLYNRALSPRERPFFYAHRRHVFPSPRALVNFYVTNRLPILDGAVLKYPMPLTRWQILPADVHLESPIGQSDLGPVYKATYRTFAFGRGPPPKPQPVIARCILEKPTLEQLLEFEKDTMLYYRLEHRNIVTTIGIVAGPRPPSPSPTSPSSSPPPPSHLIALENLTTSLFQTLRQQTGGMSEPRLLKAAEDVARGLSFMAYKDCVHRNLGVRSCLVRADGTVVLSGFSESCHVGPAWQALESLTDGLFTLRSDVWAYGVLLWELFSGGAEPFPGLDAAAIVDQYARNVRLAKPPTLPAWLHKDVLGPVWRAAPAERPSAADILHILAAHRPGEPGAAHRPRPDGSNRASSLRSLRKRRFHVPSLRKASPSSNSNISVASIRTRTRSLNSISALRVHSSDSRFKTPDTPKSNARPDPASKKSKRN